MDVARLNFSHGDHADHERVLRHDPRGRGLRGPRRRDPRRPAGAEDPAGPLRRPARSSSGAPASRCGSPSTTCAGTHDRVSTTYKGLAADVRPDDRLLVDDGKVGLRVAAVDGNDVVCRVTEGGPVSDHKGLSLPGVDVSRAGDVRQGRRGPEFALGLGVDIIALSFVRSPAELELVHQIMDETGARCR